MFVMDAMELRGLPLRAFLLSRIREEREVSDRREKANKRGLSAAVRSLSHRKRETRRESKLWQGREKKASGTSSASRVARRRVHATSS
jgi:hypothetical protein